MTLPHGPRAPAAAHRAFRRVPPRAGTRYVPRPTPAEGRRMNPHLSPILLLVCSNLFMTAAWYGHLNYKSAPLWLAVLASWAIAFIEYCFAVPANRIGHAVYSAAELKTMQEIITLIVFAGFSTFVLKEPLGWNHAAGFICLAAGAFFVFRGG
jgi:uncharacterized protein (DUF486 family)